MISFCLASVTASTDAPGSFEAQAAALASGAAPAETLVAALPPVEETAPLAEIAPDLVHPVLHKSVSELLDDAERIEIKIVK